MERVGCHNTCGAPSLHDYGTGQSEVKVPVRTGFKSRWGRISVAVPVVFLAMHSL